MLVQRKSTPSNTELRESGTLRRMTTERIQTIERLVQNGVRIELVLRRSRFRMTTLIRRTKVYDLSRMSRRRQNKQHLQPGLCSGTLHCCRQRGRPHAASAVVHIVRSRLPAGRRHHPCKQGREGYLVWLHRGYCWANRNSRGLKRFTANDKVSTQQGPFLSFLLLS